MTTNELEGRALHEAAARAMGWRFEMGAWYRGDGTFAGNHLSGCLTEREMLAWLHGRGIVQISSGHETCDACLRAIPGMAIGRDLREALARLVVAVKEQEDSK